MQKKAIEVLERLRRSRAKPRWSVEHIAALMDEYDKLGRDQFLAEVRRLLSTGRNSSQPRPKDSLVTSLENLQRKTKFNRKAFLAHVVEKISSHDTKIAHLPRSRQTLPKLIAFYEPKLGRAKLESLAEIVANEHSIVH